MFAVGIVCSKFLMSMAIMLGLLNLIIEGDFKQYFHNLKKNKFFIAVLIFYLLHIIALIWSDNMEYGLNDIRRKTSLIAIPIIVLAKPIDLRKSYNTIIFCFLGALIVTSVMNVVSYYLMGDYFEFNDIRDMSIFNSHIRYAIMIAMGIPLLLEFRKGDKKRDSVLILLIIWFLFYTYLSQILTGLISVVAILFGFVLFKLIVERKMKSLLFLFASAITGIGLLYYALFLNHEPTNQSVANFPSMKKVWNERSDIPFDSLDKRDQELKYTLSRFLDSKGLPKNGKGVSDLTTNEIMSVEKGMASESEMKIGFWGRIEGLKYQIHHTSNPNGHSLLQRIEAWDIGNQIFKDHMYLGVGTGDLDDAYKSKYKETGTKLTLENQIRAHNTYLTSLITFGGIGLISLLYMMISFIKIQVDNRHLMGFLFIFVMLVTFFFEDTLETQTGVTLFSFFAALYSVPIPPRTIDS